MYTVENVQRRLSGLFGTDVCTHYFRSVPPEIPQRAIAYTAHSMVAIRASDWDHAVIIVNELKPSVSWTPAVKPASRARWADNTPGPWFVKNRAATRLPEIRYLWDTSHPDYGSVTDIDGFIVVYVAVSDVKTFRSLQHFVDTDEGGPPPNLPVETDWSFVRVYSSEVVDTDGGQFVLQEPRAYHDRDNDNFASGKGKKISRDKLYCRLQSHWWYHSKDELMATLGFAEENEKFRCRPENHRRQCLSDDPAILAAAAAAAAMETGDTECVNERKRKRKGATEPPKRGRPRRY